MVVVTYSKSAVLMVRRNIEMLQGKLENGEITEIGNRHLRR